MPYHTILAALFCLLLQPTMAQRQGSPRVDERIEAMKAAFITERLGLTPEEAQIFWPLYNEYRDSQRELRREYRPRKPIEEMTEAEASDFLDRSLEEETQLLELRRQYLGRFQQVLPARKVALLGKVEEEFKRELLRRVRENRRRQ